jgi:putative nucleotidyltransferase with HDIG domain
MHRHGLLAELLPAIASLEEVAQSAPHHEPVLAHTLSVMRWLVAVEAAVRGPGSGETLGAFAEVIRLYGERLEEHLDRPIEGGLDGRALLRLGALFHDGGKRETQTLDDDGRIRFFGHDRAGARLAARWLRDYRFSNEAAEAVGTIVAGHMRPLLLALEGQVTRRAIFRFFRDTAPAGLDIGLLSVADHLATYDGPGPEPEGLRLLAVLHRLFDAYFQEQETVIRPAALLTGRDLMAALQLEPGPEVGRLLRHIEEAQAAGEIASRDEALALARATRNG